MDGNVAIWVLVILGAAVVIAIGISQRKHTTSTSDATSTTEPTQDHEPMPATRVIEVIGRQSDTRPIPRVVGSQTESAPSHHVTGIPVGATGRRSGRHQPYIGPDDTPLHTATHQAVFAGTSTDYGSSSFGSDGGSSSSFDSGSCD